MKKLAAIILAGMLAAGSLPFAGPAGGWAGLQAEAKTVSSAKGEHVFLYAIDRDGKSVLQDIIDLEDLKSISHGQITGQANDDNHSGNDVDQSGSGHDVDNSGNGSNGGSGDTGNDTGYDSAGNYYYSSTDNYPTTQYCEARGITIDELLAYAEQHGESTAEGSLHFHSGDSLYFMATDSYGNYTRNWSYDDLCAPERYYFEGLYDAEHGWKTGWEIAGVDNSKFGISLEEYNEKYRGSDPFYADKRQVFETGVSMPVILATESFSGRTTTETLVASTEAGIAAQIAENGGVTAGSLKDMLSDETALRLCIPMSEVDLMAAHRTAYDNFKWVYNMRLNMQDSTLMSMGTVAAPAASITQNGDTLTIELTCETPGASIYYSFDGAPQQLYTGPFTYDTKGADLTANPVTVYMTAVREGFDDAGIISVKYPQSGVVFKTMYSALTGRDLVFEAESSVTDADWKDWTESILGISVKTPSVSSYVTLNASDYRIDSASKTITFPPSVTAEAGAYTFLIYAKGYSNKRLSVSLKNGAPVLKDITAKLGEAVTVTFDNENYQKNVYLYITPEDGSKQLISAGYTDRSVPGQVSIRADWFALDSCPVKEAGTYELEVINSSYAPVSQTITLTLTEPGQDVPVVFDDVPESAWFASAVQWAVRSNAFKGVSETEFAPNTPMTRAMFATVLWRMNGSPDPDGGVTFTDVPSGKWYSDAIAWCSAKGYVNGYGGGLFGLEDSITREQMATILYRYTASDGSRKELAAVRGNLGCFADRNSVSGWADEAMQWAVGIKMINGVSADRLDPKGLATRAQTAKMLMNYENAQSSGSKAAE